ncbi:MAG: type II secretion system F family protein [Actinomycetota bacterium]|nr:type II secretion system F family protein [Actinomycetota bacterium]MDD5667452.1 type II secretion system F family protein [Actinomycetota bacterium]
MSACCALFAVSLYAFMCRAAARRREIALAVLSPREGPTHKAPPVALWAAGVRSCLAAASRRPLALTAAAGMAVLLLTRSLPLALLSLPAGALLRRFAARRGRYRASARKEEQALELIDSLSQSLRAGISLRRALEISLEDIGRELGEDVREILKDINVGGGLEESLAKAAGGSSSPSLRLTFNVLALMHARGGDLPRILHRLRQRVADGLEVRREKRILTSQSRASGYLVSSLPAFFLLLQAALNPSSLRPLFTTAAGNLIIAAAFALNAAAFFLIRKMVEQEV